MFNECTLIGRLGKDPDLRNTNSGTAVCNLWMATSETSVKNGQKTEHTEWHSVVVWQKQAETCAKYLKKGSMIFVKGRLASKEYTGSDGVKRKQWEVIAHIVRFLSSSNQGQQQQSAVEEPIDPTIVWDDVPF